MDAVKPTHVLFVCAGGPARKEVRALLHTAGFTVLEAGSATDPRLSSAPPPDLLVLGPTLPTPERQAVCAIVRGDPLRAVPVLSISPAYAAPDSAPEADCDADLYMSYPFSASLLLANTRALVRHTGALAAAVAQGRKQLDALMDQIPAAVTLLDAEGRVAMVSRYGLRALGRTAEEVRGTPPSTRLGDWVILRPDGATPVPLEEMPTMRALRQGQTVTGEAWALRRDDGTVITVQASAGPIRDDAGRITGAVAVWWDVTDLHRLQQDQQRLISRIEAGRALVEAVLQQMPAVVQITDAPSGRVLYVNAQAEQITGLPAGELRQAGHYGRARAFRPDGRELPHMEWPGARATYRGEVVRDEEMIILRPDGSRVVILVNATPVRDRDGNVIAAVLVAQDITERKRQEEELAQTVLRLGWLMEALPVGVAVAHDPEFRLVTLNPAGAGMYGAKPGENISVSRPAGEGPRFGHYQEGRLLEPRELPLRRAVAENREVRGFEVELVPPSGRARIVTINAAPAHDLEGKVVGGIAVIADITEQRQLLAAERARTQMAANLGRELTHRMKNNLATVAAMLQLQVDHSPAGEAARVPMRDAISRIRTFAVLHEQAYERQAEEVELVDALRRIAEIDRAALTGAEIAVTATGSPVTYPFQAATNLAIVANELITNAMKYGAPDATGKLTVQVGVTRRKSHLIISVWNSGRPIAPDFHVAEALRGGLSLVKGVVGYYRGSFTISPHRGGTRAQVVVADAELRRES